jgi:hypothetical protein
MATEQKRILVRRGYKADIVVTDLQPGELVFALDTNEIGVKTSGGTVLWFATLDANGKAKQDPASYGKVGGAATLNSNGKVIQDPVSYGKAGGAATLNSNGKVIQNPASYGQPNGGATLGADGIVPLAQQGIEFGSNENGSYTKFSDGTLICRKIISGTADVNKPWGTLFEAEIDPNSPWAVPFVGDAPTVLYASQWGNYTGGPNSVFIEGVGFDNNKLIGFFIARPVSSSVTYKIMFMATGRWK